jgi:phenylalanyl-tRNA synthetase beta chain
MVEKYQSVKGGLEGIVIGHVLTCVHPDADRLKITTVDLVDSFTNCLWCCKCCCRSKVPVANIVPFYTIQRRNCIHY